ncbi:Arsenate reductase, glutaredoxin family [Zobellia uliginosa]|uniref:Arsenate reductase, glutaredoxin family n=1 Tax=Zobellia uliginosa TaxID=143224 RepID=A0ABY1KW36_9FLAO|nr:hypothetical protein [Zobellia uliginosa]SIS85432.1 Arsenate reductase, glutaredoxin family [Zobellia uliginosa]
MGVISKDKKKITLYYNSGNSIGKQTYAYVESADEDILAIDISKTKVTGTQWAEIAHSMNRPVGSLVNQDHPDFKEKYGDQKVDLDEHDWLRVLEKSPSTLAYPVVIKGNRFIPIKNPSDFVKFLDDDSAGIDKPYA